jgi:hypothetical protein
MKEYMTDMTGSACANIALGIQCDFKLDILSFLQYYAFQEVTNTAPPILKEGGLFH